MPFCAPVAVSYVCPPEVAVILVPTRDSETVLLTGQFDLVLTIFNQIYNLRKKYGLLQNTNSERLDLKSFEGINIFCNMGNSSCDILCH